MRWWSWARRVETNDWRSLAYLYSAFSERSPWARATLISLGSSSWSSCSRAAISSFSFFLIFSARSIILASVRESDNDRTPSNRGFCDYLKIIEDLRAVSQMGALLLRRPRDHPGCWPSFPPLGTPRRFSPAQRAGIAFRLSWLRSSLGSLRSTLLRGEKIYNCAVRRNGLVGLEYVTGVWDHHEFGVWQTFGD